MERVLGGICFSFKLVTTARKLEKIPTATMRYKTLEAEDEFGPSTGHWLESGYP
jgi:hypothetical protein